MSPNESTVSTFRLPFTFERKERERAGYLHWDQEWRYKQSYICMTQALSTESQ